MNNTPDINDICKCCGYDFGSHSVDGLRCPKNGGHLIDGRLEYFASHFEPEISGTDQLRDEVARLTAGSEAMQEDARNNTATINMLMAQLAERNKEVSQLKEKVRYAYVQIEALEAK